MLKLPDNWSKGLSSYIKVSFSSQHMPSIFFTRNAAQMSTTISQPNRYGEGREISASRKV